MNVYKIKLNDGREYLTIVLELQENRNHEKRFQNLIWDLEEQGLEPIIDYDWGLKNCLRLMDLKTTESILDKGLFREKYKKYLSK
tara:strand:+ start:427 stop:681 length:255 start_codon:yes stop_codon:yes gene_type:complete